MKSPVPRLPDILNSCLLHMPCIVPAPISNICFCTVASRHIVILLSCGAPPPAERSISHKPAFSFG
jgi:hypothetical protein